MFEDYKLYYKDDFNILQKWIHAGFCDNLDVPTASKISQLLEQQARYYGSVGDTMKLSDHEMGLQLRIINAVFANVTFNWSPVSLPAALHFYVADNSLAARVFTVGSQKLVTEFAGNNLDELNVAAKLTDELNERFSQFKQTYIYIPLMIVDNKCISIRAHGVE